MEFDIEEVCTKIRADLSEQEFQLVKVHYKDPDSCVTYNIDGENCISSISFWSNGCCDIEYIFLFNEQRETRRYDFINDDIALKTIISEIKSAIQRA